MPDPDARLGPVEHRPIRPARERNRTRGPAQSTVQGAQPSGPAVAANLAICPVVRATLGARRRTHCPASRAPSLEGRLATCRHPASQVAVVVARTGTVGLGDPLGANLASSRRGVGAPRGALGSSLDTGIWGFRHGAPAYLGQGTETSVAQQVRTSILILDLADRCCPDEHHASLSALVLLAASKGNVTRARISGRAGGRWPSTPSSRMELAPSPLCRHWGLRAAPTRFSRVQSNKSARADGRPSQG